MDLWNPRNQTDTDFGLAPDESFEPDDSLDDVDTTQPHIRTILGPILSEELGITLVLEAIPSSWQDLEDYVFFGGRSLVMPVGDPEAIVSPRRIAQYLPLNIVDRATLTDEVIAIPVTDANGEAAAREIVTRARTDDLDRLLPVIGEGTSIAWVLNFFTLMLMDAGAEASLVRTVLIDTPARLLTIMPTDSE